MEAKMEELILKCMKVLYKKRLKIEQYDELEIYNAMAVRGMKKVNADLR